MLIKIGTEYHFVKNSEIEPDLETLTAVISEKKWLWMAKSGKSQSLEGLRAKIPRFEYPCKKGGIVSAKNTFDK